jgi:hypothetical protein
VQNGIQAIPRRVNDFPTRWEKMSTPIKFSLICASIPGIGTITSLAIFLLSVMYKSMYNVMKRKFPSFPFVIFLYTDVRAREFLPLAIPLVGNLAAIYRIIYLNKNKIYVEIKK